MKKIILLSLLVAVIGCKSDAVEEVPVEEDKSEEVSKEEVGE